MTRAKRITNDDFGVLPDLFDPSVHDHSVWPEHAKRFEQVMYRERRIAYKTTPRELAKNEIKRRLFQCKNTEQELLKEDFGSSCLYWSFSSGPCCGKVPYGKWKVKLHGHAEQIFSLRELIDEVKHERRQPRLL